jgi:xanthine dehydrogenase accessory factor
VLEIATTLRRWAAEDRRVAVATLVAVRGSTPRAVGAALAVDDTGRVVGSISGGCVESALVAECEEVLAGGPARLRTYDAGDGLEPGLMCGGTIDVHVCDLASLEPDQWHEVERAAGGRSASLTLAGTTVSVHRPPELVVVGAVEFAVALCALAARSGFAVTVLDHRATFATKERFPDATAVVVEQVEDWCARRTWSPDDAVCVLGHDLDRDTMVLASALEGGAGYVGAMGSRSTHEERVRALDGVDLTRLRSPLGLDLGGSSPEHTAVAILAEVLAVRHGGTARPLSTTTGPIHRPRPA